VRRPLALVAAVVVCAVSSAGATAAEPASLETKLTKALSGPSLSLARTSAVAVDLQTGTVLFGHNPALAVAPASNEKLPVSWAALAQLGPGYRFHTEVYGVGERSGPSWDGDLVLKGFGDPSLATADLDRLAGVIRGRGIRTVTGRIRGDESFYDSKRGGAGWKAGWVGIESPPLSALVVDPETTVLGIPTRATIEALGNALNNAPHTLRAAVVPREARVVDADHRQLRADERAAARSADGAEAVKRDRIRPHAGHADAAADIRLDLPLPSERVEERAILHGLERR